MSTKKYLKLRGRIIEKYGSYKNFAKHIRVNPQYLSCKLNGIREIQKNDITVFCDALDIGKQEIGDYFFD